MMDEFGDDSFLNDINLDAIEGGHSVYKKNSRKQASTASSASPKEEAKRRRKVSLSPADKQGISPAALETTLQNHFGYPHFREGQLDVVQAVLQQRDVAVFWATGSGKSLCYQIPALHTGKVAVVVSPLISLMEDQVNKLNGLSSESLATFLGSAQTDIQQEEGAFAGSYNIIYLTPEKLASSSTMDRLLQLHLRSRQICLFAIDESHCVSEWGHDFRPQYRQVGRVIRNHASELSQLPIMALTATAIPRVQQDICTSLQLQNPFVATASFDRTNLEITVKKKAKTSPMGAAMREILANMDSKTSTIIYAPTKSQVAEIVHYLQDVVSAEQSLHNIKVEAYHADLSISARTEAHINFLTGVTSIIVATVAFGMGIDKPDVRQVIHFGPPQTVEAYYQQIGRAGRDGRHAKCIMYVSDSDFDRYKGDFYLGRLQGEVKAAAIKSVDNLKAYALDQEICRRRALLEFFAETPTFERCGTCNNCRSRAKHADDLQRDFGPLGARVILAAAASLRNPSLTILIQVTGGKLVEDYRYKPMYKPNMVQQDLAQRKAKIQKFRTTQEFFRELVAPLVQKGYLMESTKSTKANGFQRTWTTYDVTALGKKVLANEQLPIMLPVLDSVREAERIEKEKQAAVLARLAKHGIAKEKIPENEIVSGDGEVIQAYSKWTAYIETMRRNGRESRIVQLNNLLSRIEEWRSLTSVKYRMSPSNVMSEQILVSVAYALATMPSGLHIKEADLVSAGVRSRELDQLCKILNEWIDSSQPAATEQDDATMPNKNNGKTMDLSCVKTHKWKFAEYKPNKKTGLASWESSYIRFSKGESPSAIAMSPANGRPIQVRTVCMHIMQAVLHGRVVNLANLVAFMPPPTSNEWEQLEAAEIANGFDVTAHSGTGNYTKTEHLRSIVGDQLVDTPSPERSEADKKKMGLWFEKVEWYTTLKRAGWNPVFK